VRIRRKERLECAHPTREKDLDRLKRQDRRVNKNQVGGGQSWKIWREAAFCEHFNRKGLTRLWALVEQGKKTRTRGRKNKIKGEDINGVHRAR